VVYCIFLTYKIFLSKKGKNWSVYSLKLIYKKFLQNVFNNVRIKYFKLLKFEDLITIN